MLLLNLALDSLQNGGGEGVRPHGMSLPSLGDGSPEMIPLLALVDLVWRTNAERR